jgi:hypothetical protein
MMRKRFLVRSGGIGRHPLKSVVFKEHIEEGVSKTRWQRGGSEDMWWWRRHGECWYPGKERKGCREVKAAMAEPVYRMFKDARLTFTNERHLKKIGVVDSCGSNPVRQSLGCKSS